MDYKNIPFYYFHAMYSYFNFCILIILDNKRSAYIYYFRRVYVIKGYLHVYIIGKAIVMFEVLCSSTIITHDHDNLFVRINMHMGSKLKSLVCMLASFILNLLNTINIKHSERFSGKTSSGNTR